MDSDTPSAQSDQPLGGDVSVPALSYVATGSAGTPQASGTATGNPLGESFNITVSVPESIEIKMVNASTLSDYEIWFFIASVLASAVIGFLVGTFQAFDAKAANAPQLLWTTIVWIVLFVIAIVTTFVKRYKLKKTGKSIKLRTTQS